MIEFNYKDALSQARELDRISDELRRIQATLNRGKSELAGAWKGDSANLFLSKAEELCGDIGKTAKTTAGISSAVEVAAKAIKAAEDAAQEIVKAVGLS